MYQNYFLVYYFCKGKETFALLAPGHHFISFYLARGKKGMFKKGVAVDTTFICFLGEGGGWGGRVKSAGLTMKKQLNLKCPLLFPTLTCFFQIYTTVSCFDSNGSIIPLLKDVAELRTIRKPISKYHLLLSYVCHKAAIVNFNKLE